MCVCAIVKLCSCTCELCVRVAGRIKETGRRERGFGGRKVMGLWGSENESKFVMIFFSLLYAVDWGIYEYNEQ